MSPVIVTCKHLRYLPLFVQWGSEAWLPAQNNTRTCLFERSAFYHSSDEGSVGCHWQRRTLFHVCVLVRFQEKRRRGASLLGPAERAFLYLQVEPLRHRLPLHHIHVPPREKHQRCLHCSHWCKLIKHAWISIEVRHKSHTHKTFSSLSHGVSRCGLFGVYFQ